MSVHLRSMTAVTEIPGGSLTNLFDAPGNPAPAGGVPAEAHYTGFRKGTAMPTELQERIAGFLDANPVFTRDGFAAALDLPAAAFRVGRLLWQQVDTGRIGRLHRAGCSAPGGPGAARTAASCCRATSTPAGTARTGCRATTLASGCSASSAPCSSPRFR